MRSLAANLILRERIKTTKARAKETGKAVEKLITKAKTNSLAARRSLASALPLGATQKLIKEIAPRFAARVGGYTRVIRLGQRLKDGSEIAIVEFVQMAQPSAKKGKIAKEKKASGKAGAKKPAKPEKETSKKIPEIAKEAK